MIEEAVEITRLADELGFDAVAVNEHHFHTEGIETGGQTPLQTYLAAATKRIKIGIIGYVLPSWDPIRLATETAWMDQVTKGRIFVGLAAGYQSRWLGTLGQMYGIKGDLTDKEDSARTREVFREVYEIMKLSWADEPFSYDGKFYKVPFPKNGGIKWAPHELTRSCGAPGELDTSSLVQKISPVPKPYQKPYPPLFQAQTHSESTFRWCAREGIIPISQMSIPSQCKQMAQIYLEEARGAGHNLKFGQNTGVSRTVVLGSNRQDAIEHGTKCQFNLWKHIWGPYGFFETFRLPSDQGAVPITVERLIEAKSWLVGTPDDVRRQMDDLVENCNPDWFLQITDQGFTSLYEAKKQVELLGTKILPHYRNS
jgi:alkanesulfonate monooxygenase SsuD/methylene tetrahydromethanopterin reductase-like flavin-dependent oxidoreductase (luciferase family)